MNNTSNYYVETENRTMSQDGVEIFAQHFARSDGECQPHIHSSLEMLFIAKGRFRVYSENAEYLASEGDAILFRPRTIHRMYATENDSLYYVVKLHPSFLLGISSAEQGISYLLMLSLYEEGMKFAWSKEECDQNGISHYVARLVKELTDGRYCADIALKICAAEILLILLRELERESAPVREQMNGVLTRRIYDAILYINNHYSEPITALDCSQSLYMSYSYFSRSFKQITGKSFKAYLMNTRINRAEKALLATKKPITQIALECGFNNIAYFSAVYKQIKGVSPTDARKDKNVLSGGKQ